MQWIILLIVTTFALVTCWPPKERLKLGIDLAGGTSLLYEIDTSGLREDEQYDLSTRVMEILKERVDPKATMNLVWRPVGHARLEVQMPLPSKEALARRQEKEKAFEVIRQRNVRRFDLETALSAGPDRIDSALVSLVRDVPSRAPLLTALREAADQRKSAPNDATARAAYERAVEAVLNTNVDENRVRDVLELTFNKPAGREAELKKLIDQHPSYADAIQNAARAYDAWAARKSELEDPSDLKRRLKGAGVLEFRILAQRNTSSPNFMDARDPSLREPIAPYIENLQKRGPRIRGGERYAWHPVKDIVDFQGLDRVGMTEAQFESVKDSYTTLILDKYAGQWYVLAHNDPEYCMTHRAGRSWKLQQAFPNIDSRTGQNVVSFQLDPVGGDLFSELTGNNVNRQLCVFLDGQAMSHANINERIGSSGQISGNFTKEKVNELVRTLEAGALPGRLKDTPLSEKTIGPSLGEHNLESGLRAAKWGFGLLLVFVVVYYGITAGMIANLALVLNLILLLGAMAFLQATFTLPGIAGVALSLGMAIDANVLIFERIREERARNMPLRKAIALGYEKALSSIIDGNVTTLISCVVLIWVGSEEVKGFGITLGIGLVVNLYTAVLVTRLVFETLLSLNMIKDLTMRRFFARPNIDWMGKRKAFFTFSAVTTALGLTSFVFLSTQNREAAFDIELIGGTAVEVEFLENQGITDEEVRRLVSSSEPGQASVANWLAQAANLLDEASLRTGEAPGVFILESASNRLNGEQIRALMSPWTESLCSNVTVTGQAVVFHTHVEQQVTQPKFAQLRSDAAQYLRTRAAANLRTARAQRVQTGADDEETTRHYEIVTVETNLKIVQTGILAVMSDKLKVERPVNFRLVEDAQTTLDKFFVIEEEDRYLSDVIGGDYSFDIHRYKGGVCIQLTQLDPPLTFDELDTRLRQVQLMPEYLTLQGRDRAIFQLSPPVRRPDGKEAYTSFAVLAVDDHLPYRLEDDDRWRDVVARPELAQVEAALATSKTLRKVLQFAPQVADAAKADAMAAIVLAMIAILGYVWLRFKGMDFGLAAIVATFHDVAFTLGMLALSHVIGSTFLGPILGIFPFKVDLPMIAALLTIIGYSLNDTVVVFDRIRENRGKGAIHAGVINDSINQTLSRTVLTGGTTLIMIICLYLMGGEGVRGFCYAFLVGVIIGTYSSVAVASPLLYRADKLYIVSKVMVGLLAASLVVANVSATPWRIVWLLVIATATGYWIMRGRMSGTVGRLATR